MSAPKDMNFGHLAAAINGITNVETLVIFSKAIIMPFVTGHALVTAVVNMANGAGAATVTLKLYRGVDLTGTLVYTTAAFNMAANANTEFSLMFEEDLTNQATLSYALSVTNSVNQAGNNVTAGDIVTTIL